MTTETGAEPRTTLTRERVLRAAIDLADREGLAALSMRQLGQEVDVEAMSLYNHVANKDDVLDGVVDVIIDEINEVVDGHRRVRRVTGQTVHAPARAGRPRCAAAPHAGCPGVLVRNPDGAAR